MGKGSKQRPTDHAKFSQNWDVIFGSPSEDTIHPFNCSDCGGIDEADVLETEVLDREPFGDQTVDRITYYYECAICGSDYVERNK